jgi:catechol 2,3-dioxygenase-like lactoylglutathione lyase family enzyme
MSHTRETIVDGIADPSPERKSIIKPYVMSHGTLECRSLKKSRRFYEEFLGLECVRHAVPAMVIRCGLKFHVVCVEVGDNVHPLNVLNHWGIDVESQEKVDEAYQNALKYKDEYEIRQVLKPVSQHGVYSFYLEDLDHNWWEVQHIPGFQHEDMFDFGDRYSMDDESNPAGLTELAVKNSAH